MEKMLLVSSSRRRSRREGVLLLPGSAGFKGSGARGVGVAIWKCLLRITSAGVGTEEGGGKRGTSWDFVLAVGRPRRHRSWATSLAS